MNKNGKQYTKTYTPQELKYKLFGKKVCPICLEKMVLMKESEYKGVGRGGMGASYGFAKYNADLYEIRETYYCKKCDKNYTISELIKIKEK